MAPTELPLAFPSRGKTAAFGSGSAIADIGSGRPLRLWILSDLHLSHEEAFALRTFGPVPEADVCVMAGDLSKSMALSLRWMGEVVRPHMPCVFVPGNHEFFGTSIDEGLLVGKAVAGMADVAFLDGDSATVAGVRFAGGTLWSDFALYASGDGAGRARGVAAMMDASRGRADYARIRLSGDEDSPGFRLLRPEDTAAIHAETLGGMEAALENPFEGPTVVVTHHAPHRGSIAPEYANGDERTPSSVSCLCPFIERHRPAAWVHGHVHQTHDYRVGDSRILCNPRGYMDEESGFVWDRVIEVVMRQAL